MSRIFLKRLEDLLSVRSLVILALTAVNAIMVLRETASQDLVTVYAMVIAFYFGTQAHWDTAPPDFPEDPQKPGETAGQQSLSPVGTAAYGGRAAVTPVERLLDIARLELGVQENPPNSNNVKYNTWFYGRPVSGSAYPWCMAFVQWVFDQAGMRLPYITASCSGLLNWYRANRPERVFSSPQAGDIVIYNFGHTGIVESVGSGTITAIEGNTSPSTAGSQSNDGMVCRKTRSTSLVTAYIRPADETEDGEPAMDNTPSAVHKEGVEWAVNNGLLAGNADGNLMLSQPVTRQQLCTILYRFAKLIVTAFESILYSQ